MPIVDLLSGRAPLSTLARPLRRKRCLLDYLNLQRQRQSLRDLSPHQLRDIGLTEEAAEQEASRPIWDVPGHWRR